MFLQPACSIDLRGGPFDSDGGVVQIPQKISSICFWLKKVSCRILKKEKKIEQPYKPGRGKGFCVMRDGPKSSCESHDTGLGITFFDA